MPKLLSLLFAILISHWNIFAGTINISVSSLPSFGNAPVFFASEPQRMSFSASALGGPLLINAPNQFEVSLTYSGGYATQLQINPVAGNVTNTVLFVRFSPYVSAAHSGNVVFSSSGSSSMSCSVSGTGLIGNGASSYYNTISTSSSAATLKTALYSKILGHTVTSYSGLWATYTNTDKLFNGKVWDIYSTRLDTVSPFEFIFSTDQCGTYSLEGDCYNREHSFPQSWFNSSSPMVSDMFHIYPTDGKVNGVRNNFPFGEVGSTTYTSMQGARLGSNITSGYSSTTFEPINEYKGDLARSFFYMATRYENLFASWQSNGNADEVLSGNSFPGYDAWVINLLLKWHNQDPPGVKEINRNNAIFNYQGNRNPFIDSPQYANRIWGSPLATEPMSASTQFVVKSNTLTTAHIAWKTGGGQKRIVIARAGAPVNALPQDSFNYLASSVFGSGSQIGSGNYVVYNGMGASIQVTGLNSSLVYYFTVIEYNGQMKTANYLTSSVLQSSGVILPVTWLQTKVEWENEQSALLTWQTASEINNSHFTIERMGNAGEFESIGKVNASTQLSGIRNYQYSDPAAGNQIGESGVIQYRIKQHDLDGKFSYSPVLWLTMQEITEPNITVTNPAEGNIRVFSNQQGKPITLILTNGNGVEVFRTQRIMDYEMCLTTETALPPGMYFLAVVQRSKQQHFKIIIQ